eukprot:GFUD01047625.1.p1 GENE.GFUD01047625.1~~GFUD01047625.1.p1  ORF type:complete len:294 (+),score=61.21 GFUD01047625.1:132-884(+)
MSMQLESTLAKPARPPREFEKTLVKLTRPSERGLNTSSIMWTEMSRQLENALAKPARPQGQVENPVANKAKLLERGLASASTKQSEMTKKLENTFVKPAIPSERVLSSISTTHPRLLYTNITDICPADLHHLLLQSSPTTSAQSFQQANFLLCCYLRELLQDQSPGQAHTEPHQQEQERNTASVPATLKCKLLLCDDSDSSTKLSKMILALAYMKMQEEQEEGASESLCSDTIEYLNPYKFVNQEIKQLN